VAAELQWRLVSAAVCPASVVAHPELACAWQDLFPQQESLQWRDVWALLAALGDR
jgi:hypothetical protein